MFSLYAGTLSLGFIAAIVRIENVKSRYKQKLRELYGPKFCLHDGMCCLLILTVFTERSRPARLTSTCPGHWVTFAVIGTATQLRTLETKVAHAALCERRR